MINLMIVDDDEIICKGLSKCIDWGALGVQVVATAFDGESALEHISCMHVDILIVDICMPFVDGIELSTIVRNEFDHIQVIMLTAYKEFRYAQKAIELHICDYITKPFENRQIEQAVARAAQNVLQSRKSSEQERQSQEMQRESYLCELLAIGVSPSNEKQINSLINADGKSYFCACAVYFKTIDDSIQGNNEKQLFNDELSTMKFHKTAGDYLRSLGNAECFCQSNKIAVLFKLEPNSGIGEVRAAIDALFRTLSEEDDYFVSAGIGDIYKGIENAHYSYAQAKRNASHCYEFGNYSIITNRSLNNRIASLDISMASYKKIILNYVKCCDIAGIEKGIDDFFEHINQFQGVNLRHIQFLAMDLVAFIYKSTENEALYDRYLCGAKDSYIQLVDCLSLGGISSWVQANLGCLREYAKVNYVSETEKVVNQAVRYISENSSDAQLSLKDVAEHVHISQGYLCKLFKQYSKGNYASILLNARIENAAKLLLKGDYKAYQIAHRVGFNSSQYFSSCFKKIMGVPPGEYKESIEKL